MSLEPGRMLSHYRLVEKIGEGGMGVVWKAVDTRLDREAAVKILPREFSEEPDRLARFEREAKVLASLDHPHIARIYGLDHDQGVHFLAMELVRGASLQSRLDGGPLPVDEALAIARQMAAGLAAAHAAGVVHRDIKPGNVVVTPEGQVKVLDFGLAKIAGPDAPGADLRGTMSPTLTAGTMVGVILGTASYMSPEQARGRPIDQRSDIWSFGAVLYEMITGSRAFTGDSVTDILGAIIHKEVDWDRLPAETPPAVRRLLRRCLARDAGERLHSIADARLDIDEALTAGHADPGPPAAAALPRRRLPAIAALLVAGLIAGTIAGWMIWSRGGTAESRVRRFSILTAPLKTADESVTYGVALAPDGSYLVYVAGDPRQLYVRRLDQMESVPLPGTEGASMPFISPDGESIGFVVRDQVRALPRSGGAPVTLHTFRDASSMFAAGASWAPDGTIYIAAPRDGYSTLWRIPPGGGGAEPLVPLSDDRGVRREDAVPQILPGGTTLLFGSVAGDTYWDYRDGRIKALDLATGSETLVLEGGFFVRYLETGHILFVSGDSQVSIAPFDTRTLRITGPARPLPIPVVLRQGRCVNLVTSSDGTLVYEDPGAGDTENQAVWIDRTGRETPVLQEPRALRSCRLSPRGDRIVMSIEDPDGGARLWIHDIARRMLSPVSPPGSSYDNLAWTPDGRHVLALRQENRRPTGIYRIAVDGAFAESLVHDPNTPWAAPVDVSPDGRFLAMIIWSLETDKDWDIRIVPIDGAGPPATFARETTDEMHPRFSPDGRWLAYTSNRSGRQEVYVKRFPEEGAAIQVSGSGGTRPLWSAGGSEILYFEDRPARLVAVSLKLDGPDPDVGAPRKVVDLPADLTPPDWRHWADLSPDGSRLLMIRQPGAQSARLDVVLNWYEELRALPKP